MTKHRLKFVPIIVAVGVLLAACGGDSGSTAAPAPSTPAPQQPAQETPAPTITPRVLSYATMIPETTPHMSFTQEWMRQVTDQTGGAITFEPYWSGSLCAATEIPDCLRDGRVDLGWTASAYTPNDYPATFIMNMPFLTGNVQAKINAMYEFATTHPLVQAEYTAQNIKFLYMSPSNPPILAMKDEVATVADLNGRSIIGTGLQGAAYAELGMNVTAITPSERYETVQRGVAGGVLDPLDVLVDFRIFEVADYFYDLGQYSGSANTLHHAINLDVWNSLEPAVQDVMVNVSATLHQSMLTGFFVEAEKEQCALVLENVKFFGDLGPEAELKAWASTMKGDILGRWRQNAADGGVSASDIEDVEKTFLALIVKHEGTAVKAPTGAETCKSLVK